MPAETAVETLGRLPLGELSDTDVLVLADALEETGDTERAAWLRSVNGQNRVRSAREVREWMESPPDTYFAYVRMDPMPPDRPAGSNWRGRVVTWIGDSLGSCIIGRVWRDNFGGKRRSVTLRGTNGHTYAGTYFCSAGDYCRLRRLKRPLTRCP